MIGRVLRGVARFGGTGSVRCGAFTFEEIASALDRDGVVLIENALTGEETAAVRRGEEELRRLHEEQGSAIRDARFYRGKWPEALAEVQRWPTIVRLITHLLGPDIALYFRRFLIKDPLFKDAITCHQELPYFHGGVTKISVFLPISPNTVANGALRYYAGSHKYGLIGQGDIQADRFEGVRDVGADLGAGDLILMDHRTWHHSAAATSSDPRYLLQLFYQPSDDGSYVDQPELVCGKWRTDLRFPASEALTYYSVKRYVEENKQLRATIDELNQQLEELKAGQQTD